VSPEPTIKTRTTKPKPDPADLHEWVSFDDPEGHTWVFDLTFLTSNWTCVWGRGCPGVLDDPAPELEQGCCSYGAHFTEKADRKRVEKQAERLSAKQWRHKKTAEKLGGAIWKNEEDEWVTRTVDDVCIFFNPVGFSGGTGCALHGAAVEAGERPLDWKPDVCWQLPLRYEESLDDNDHLTVTLREWKRRDWGEGGFDFHWWCTDHADAFVGGEPVYLALKDEITAMIGDVAYGQLADHIEGRGSKTLLPHPVVKRR
jgi:hypothetical protein